MPDTTTTVLGLVKPEVGASTDTWGPKYHSALDSIDALFTDPAKKMLKLANGGTGADTAAGARTNLGLGALATLGAVGTAQITDASVTTPKIADAAVTSAKIADGAVTSAKLDPAAFLPSGTRLLFQQTAAPTGWTKDTTHNDKALRIVNGTVGTGGTVSFTSAMANRSISGTSNSVTVTGTVGGTALTIDQIPSHTHGVGVSNTYSQGGNNPAPGTGTTRTSTAAGGGLAHDHPFTGGSHSHTVSASLDMAIQYVDVIIAVKN